MDKPGELGFFDHGFKGKLILDFVGPRLAYLVQDYSYRDLSGHLHAAKAGLATDGGTIPRMFWSIIGSPYTYALPAYVIHDHYAELARHLYTADPDAARLLRYQCDQLFVEMLEYLGVNWMKRNIMYRAVRLEAIYTLGSLQELDIEKWHANKQIPRQMLFRR